MDTTTRRSLVAAGTAGRGAVLAIESLEAALELLPAGDARDAVAAELASKLAEAQQVLDNHRAAQARRPRITRGRIS